MALTKEELRHLARLARLQLRESEEGKMGDELDRILEYVGRLQKIDTTGVPETETAQAAASFRGDVALPCDEAARELILSNFPDRAGDALRVPAVFEKPKG